MNENNKKMVNTLLRSVSTIRFNEIILDKEKKKQYVKLIISYLFKKSGFNATDLITTSTPSDLIGSFRDNASWL